ncbi:MAG: sulfurtransferase [Betaproteobacteria bacterium RBG_19FT_COMBO_58_11]|nr:MAG: sulfurtransferase [Betaproteobacteria bacterium RBG_19FT_COMBO_58_11]
MKWLHLLGFLLLMLSLGGCAAPPYTNIDNAQLKTLRAQGVPIYDVRRPDEWHQTGVVEGSHKLTFVDTAGRLNPEFLPRFGAEVDKHAPVILICRTGSRTDKLARELVEKMGYTQVYNVRDGITGWISENNPVIKH